MIKQYLGDSVYAEWDGWAVILTTENGNGPSNTIVIEHAVCEALKKFVEMHVDGRPMTNPAELKPLLPCPFCGSPYVLISGPVNDGPDDPLDLLNLWAAVCRNETCCISGPNRETENECIDAWNTRATKEER